MIDSTSGFLKLIDFGSAVHVVKDRGVKLAHLTDFWSAPETRYQHTLLDSQESLLKSDIYSAALIFLTMYHGRV